MVVVKVVADKKMDTGRPRYNLPSLAGPKPWGGAAGRPMTLGRECDRVELFSDRQWLGVVQAASSSSTQRAYEDLKVAPMTCEYGIRSPAGPKLAPAPASP